MDWFAAAVVWYASLPVWGRGPVTLAVGALAAWVAFRLAVRLVKGVVRAMVAALLAFLLATVPGNLLMHAAYDAVGEAVSTGVDM